jgi:hypothetical protein
MEFLEAVLAVVVGCAIFDFGMGFILALRAKRAVAKKKEFLESLYASAQAEAKASVALDGETQVIE